MSRRLRRGLLISLAALAVLEAAYVVGANWYLREALLPRLNHRPERLVVEYASARTWLPGLVHVRGLRIRQQNRRTQWLMTLDEGRMRASLLALGRRELRGDGFRGRGLSLRLRFIPRDGGEGSPHAPPIDGFAGPPVPAGTTAPPRVGGREPWAYRFRGMSVEDVREAWIGAYRFTGAGRIEGSVRVQARRVLELDDVTLEVHGGEVSLGGSLLVDSLAGSVSCAIDGFDPRTEAAAAVLDHLDGSARLHGLVPALELEDARFKRMPWLVFEGTSGSVATDIVVERGRLAPDSTFELDARRLSFSYPGYTVEGVARVAGRVEEGPGGPLGTATARFDDFTIRRRGEAEAHVRGTGFHAEVATTDLDLRDPLSTFAVDLVLPESRVEDLTVYNANLPSGIGFRIESGTGRIHGQLHATESGGSGDLSLTGDAVRASYADLSLHGDLTLDVKLPVVDMSAGDFDLSGTRLAIRDAGVEGRRSEEGWWATVDLPSGRVSVEPPYALDVAASARMRDSDPLLEIVGVKKRVVRVFRGLLRDEDVAVTARLRADRTGFDLVDLDLRGKALTLRACLSARGPARRGVFYVDRGALSAGVQFAGGRDRLTLFANEEWFPRRAGLCRGEGALLDEAPSGQPKTKAKPKAEAKRKKG